MDYLAFWKVNEKLRELIEENTNITNERVLNHFPSGDDQESPQGGVAVILYQVAQNEYLSNITSKEDMLPPLAFDLRYLLVPYAKDKRKMLEILGLVTRLLHDYPVLEVDGEKIKITHEDLSLDKLNILWSSLEGDTKEPLKLCLSYIVSPVLIRSTRRSIYTKKIKEISLTQKKMYPLDFLFYMSLEFEEFLMNSLTVPSNISKEFDDNGYSASIELHIRFHEKEKYWRLVEILETGNEIKEKTLFYIFKNSLEERNEQGSEKKVLKIYQQSIEKYREDLIDPLKEEIKKHKYYVMKGMDSNGKKIIEVMEKPKDKLDLKFLDTTLSKE